MARRPWPEWVVEEEVLAWGEAGAALVARVVLAQLLSSGRGSGVTEVRGPHVPAHVT